MKLNFEGKFLFPENFKQRRLFPMNLFPVSKSTLVLLCSSDFFSDDSSSNGAPQVTLTKKFRNKIFASYTDKTGRNGYISITGSTWLGFTKGISVGVI